MKSTSNAPVKFNIQTHKTSSNKHPSNKLFVIGITGTNGKTSVSYLLGEVLKAAGYNTFVLGTMNSGNNDLSTPESSDTQRFMNQHLEQGGTHFIMEVTSEGIDQHRLKDIDFDLKLLTNITQDHLDYHKTFERYQQTKLDFMREGSGHKVYPANFNQELISFKTKLIGEFNLLNIKAAVNILRQMNIPESLIQNTLSICLPPRGRVETVDKGQAFKVIVDYAHTPDGLLNVLTTLKTIAKERKGRLLVMFGCGGNRDTDKRPKMGKIASDIADLLVITDDNPRQENRQMIMSDIIKGIDADFQNYTVMPNRKMAIQYIINQSEDNDVVVLAGKGHETYQILKSGTVDFDDREEAINALLVRLKKEH